MPQLGGSEVRAGVDQSGVGPELAKHNSQAGALRGGRAGVGVQGVVEVGEAPVGVVVDKGPVGEAQP